MSETTTETQPTENKFAGAIAATAEKNAQEIAQADADRIAKAQEAFKPRLFKQVLPVRLTQSEKERIADQVAALDVKRDEQEAAKKAAADKAKAEIELTEQQIKELLANYRKGTEDREVECVETFNFANNTATISRGDNGQVLETRALTTAERQRSLFPEEPKATAKADAAPDGGKEDAGDDDGDGATTTTRRSKRRKDD